MVSSDDRDDFDDFISQMISDIELVGHLCIIFEKCLCRSFAHFYVGLFYFFVVEL